jgi:hypothetical protein
MTELERVNARLNAMIAANHRFRADNERLRKRIEQVEHQNAELGHELEVSNSLIDRPVPPGRLEPTKAQLWQKVQHAFGRLLTHPQWVYPYAVMMWGHTDNCPPAEMIQGVLEQLPEKWHKRKCYKRLKSAYEAWNSAI